jgi:phospholipid/cholesterol/gamma-HCH transport system ATP-binding protein
MSLVFEHITHRFADGPPVLDDLSGTVPFDGLTFVVGKSGGGKSVLCRLAVGLLEPTAGDVRVEGTSLRRLDARARVKLRRQVPYLVQQPALLDWLSLAENVALANRSADPQDVEQVLSRVGLRELADRAPTSVGPGVSKRAAIARALLLQPKYLLFDEPTTGLEHTAAEEVFAVLRGLKERRLGALIVSHDYDAVRLLADRVWVVANGRLAFEGSADQFFTSEDPAVRSLTDP